jgi:very-short-patch-repair endonuclease
VHVTVPSESRRRRQGIAIDRSRTLDAGKVTRRQGIPVTTPTRTLADLGRTLPQKLFSAALRQAEFLDLPIEPSLGPGRKRSEPEARFLWLCRRHRLPAPAVNVRAGPFTVVFLWRESGLVVELDGYSAHGGRSAFEADRERDVRLTALGFVVLRFTWRSLADSSRVASMLQEVLRRTH